MTSATCVGRVGKERGVGSEGMLTLYLVHGSSAGSQSGVVL